MLISVKNKFVFVANTKTASTSIEHALMPHCEIYCGGTPARKHLPMHMIWKEYGFLFNQPNHPSSDYFKFGVMRDPIDWIGSWFRYRKGNKVESPLPDTMPFVDFWKQKDWNIYRSDGTRHLQKDMFIGPKGYLWADMIIPYSKLNSEFSAICDALDIRCPLPRKNVSNLTRNADFPANLVAEMKDFYAEDYELWDKLDEINARGMTRLIAARQGPHQNIHLP